MIGLPSWQERRRGRQSHQSIALHIDELVLHGVAQSDVATLTAAFSEELSRLAAQPASFAPLRAGHLQAAPYAAGAPRETGQAVAASVWAGVRQQGRTR
jgi:hypothetical protein